MKESLNKAPAAAATVKIITALAETHKPINLTEISTLADLNTNMTIRVLTVLVESGWVVFKEETGKYSLSLSLFRLSSTALQKNMLIENAMPYLHKLNDFTNECIQMAVYYQNQAVYIAQLESKNIARISGQIGASYSIDNTAPGKILKAFILKDPSPEMEEIRKKGYSLDSEEYSRGVICMAVPVFDYTGEAIAAIGIASLTILHSLEKMVEKYLNVLLENANKLSMELGFNECSSD